jgi:uncharacterized repeat protein (TIGR02543 family)
VVSFQANGGTAVSNGSFVTAGGVGAPSSPYRAGYTFLGWSSTDGGSSVGFPYYPGVASNITLFALWSAESHNIFFLSNGSYVYYLSFVTDGSVAAPLDPVRAGYTFKGWSATDGGTTVSFPYAPGVTGLVVLHALWSINTYVVSYNSKGGSYSAASPFVFEGLVASAPKNPYRLGAVFLGWSASDGGSAVSFPYVPGVASNVTLYARWSFLAPLLSTSTAVPLSPGEVVTLRVSRVEEGCTVSVGWVGDNTGVSSVSRVIGVDRSTGVFAIATPSVPGRYTLRTNRMGSECTNGGAVTLAKSFLVGKSSSLVAKLASSSAFASKSPVVTVSGKLKSGGAVVVGRELTVSLRRNGVEVVSATATTSASGEFIASFSGITFLAGDYTAVVSGVADSMYLPVQGTANKLVLR